MCLAQLKLVLIAGRQSLGLLLLAKQTIANGEHLNAGALKTTEGVIRCAYNRLASHVEAGIDHGRESTPPQATAAGRQDVPSLPQRNRNGELLGQRQHFHLIGRPAEHIHHWEGGPAVPFNPFLYSRQPRLW